MFKKIFVAIDGSEASDEAIRLAIALARDQKAQLVFCHALEEIALMRSATAASIDPLFAFENARKYGQTIVDDAVKRAADAGVHASSTVVEDDPVHAIVNTARDVFADIIVLGTHGRKGIARAVLGSAAEAVLRDSPVPVLVVRHRSRKAS